jgi:branched-chain amino acid transport system substrate-binding protein
VVPLWGPDKRVQVTDVRGTMIHRHRFRLIAAGVLAAATFSTVAVVSTGSAGASTPTKSPLDIGVISADTSVQTGQTSHDVPRALAVWQNYTNSHGGIDGHPVNVTEKNDSGDPAQGLADAKAFVADPNIIAIFSNDVTSEPAYAPFLDSSNIPVFCLNSTSSGFSCQSNANFFPAGTTVLTIVYGQPYVAKLEGGNKFGTVQCAEVAACSQALPLDKAGAEAIGSQFVYGAIASSTAPNYTAQCLAAKAAGANALFVVPGALTFYDNCAAQGYHPIYVQSSAVEGGAIAPFLADPNTNKAIGDIGVFPWFTDDSPGAQTFKTAFGSEWPNFKGYTSPPVVAQTWAGAQLFAAAAKAANIGNTVTRQDIFNGVYALPKNFTLDGTIPPETITQGQPTSNDCFFVFAVKSHKLVAPYGDKTFCEPKSLTKST